MKWFISCGVDCYSEPFPLFILFHFEVVGGDGGYWMPLYAFYKGYNNSIDCIIEHLIGCLCTIFFILFVNLNEGTSS